MRDRNHFSRLELVRLDRRSRGLHHDLGRRRHIGFQRLIWRNLVTRGIHVVDVEGAILFALYFASSGVESLRVGLNRAYDASEPRPWWLLRLESIGYVLVGAVAILAFSFLVVLAPLIWNKLLHYVPTLEPFSRTITFARYAVAAFVLVIALMIVHRWLPAGRRAFVEIAPGIAATILLWLISGAAFGR